MEECRLTSAAIAGQTWIAQVCSEVDKCIEAAREKYVDKFSLSEIFAHLYVLLSAFSRAVQIGWHSHMQCAKHKSDLFVTTISLTDIRRETLRNDYRSFSRCGTMVILR